MVDFACGRQRFDLAEAVDGSSMLFGSVVDGKPRSINEQLVEFLNSLRAMPQISGKNSHSVFAVIFLFLHR
ncbi:hypothetical protein NZK35_23495 [Stieleria sp. ICT_E10.1]|uniref:hypothetical protein n=1 Tax=Stieleria sedimenti TaxID=2976331 RepID=UPI0021803913|nr:hypothetical protein [Stieleria sedimenti]MCS7469626.1 hypothetical protein [Stieleria sedimenti]